MDYLKDTAHIAGDGQCPTCVLDYPRRCKCGGWIHGSEIEESWDHKSGKEYLWVLFQKCDRCGDDWQEAE